MTGVCFWERLTVVEEKTTGVLKLKETVTKDESLFAAINVNDCVMKFKFENAYGCFHSLNDGIMRATDGRKRALVFRHCDVGEGCNSDLRDSGARLVVAECDLTRTLQACIEGSPGQRRPSFSLRETSKSSL